MKLFHLFLTSLIFTTAMADNAWVERAKLPVPKIETLPNGLTVAWFMNDKIPVIDMGILIQSGYRSDPSGKSGTAQLLSSVLDRGSKGMSASQMVERVDKLGASHYVSADDDSFTVGVHGLAQDAETLLEFLGDVVLTPDLIEPEVTRERARMADRWEHIGDEAQTLASLVFHRILTTGTSYARGGLASVRELKNVNRKDVLDFYKTHFTPKNAVFMVVGKVDQAAFTTKLLARFGAWKGEAPKKQFKNYSAAGALASGAKGILVPRKDLTQAQLRFGFEAPKLQVPEHYALSVANAILGEYFNSRLNSLIRDKLALTYNIQSNFSYSQDMALFSISTSCRNEVTGLMVHNVKEVLKKFRTETFTDEEVNQAKDYLLGSFPLGTSTLSAVASRWLAGYIFKLGPEYLNEFIPKVSAVKAVDVQNAVKKYFDESKLRVVIAGSDGPIQKSLKEAKIPALKLVKVEDLK